MKSIIITGAAGNLGKAVIQRMADRNHHIHAALGLGENSQLFNKTIHNKNITMQFVNLADETVADGYVKSTILKDPTVSAAILLVGGWQPGTIAETTSYEIDKMLKLNFQTAFNVVKPLMEFFERNGGGQFVFVGARPGINPADASNQISYALSKSLIFRLAEIINEEGKLKNIRAHVVVPSVLDTPLNHEIMPMADSEGWVKVEDVAESIAFLFSEAGQNLRETVIKLYKNA